jgi:hypothetical protein
MSLKNAAELGLPSLGPIGLWHNRHERRLLFKALVAWRCFCAPGPVPDGAGRAELPLEKAGGWPVWIL